MLKPNSRLRTITLFMLSLVCLVACGGGGSGTSNPPNSADNPVVEPPPDPRLLAIEYLSGGEATVNRQDEDAFSQSPPSIASNFSEDAIFKQGNFLFRGSHDNAGPLLNNASCQGCHIKDGRGNPPQTLGEPLRSMLLKLNLGVNSSGDTIADPIYGSQLQTFGLDQTENQVEASYEGALDGVSIMGEARVSVTYESIDGKYPDGSNYTLQQPVYRIFAPAYGDFAQGLTVSPRVAPPMIGLGLLEAIPEAAILALEDIEDTNNDGISGRAKFIENSTTDTLEIGRFGWKGSTGSVLQQSANAYRGDIGITNRFALDENCTQQQAACLLRAEQESNIDEEDLTDLSLAFVEFYSRLLAVPQRRGYDTNSQTWESDIEQGRRHFEEAQCAVCHVRHHRTGLAAESALGQVDGLSRLVKTGDTIDVLSDQDIWPHTDLLLHDMGGSCDPAAREDEFGNSCNAGENCAWVFRCEGLADGQIDGDASGTEWRTAPLWGLGLTKTVNSKAGFLHDGRARTIEEAILWHGGEAERSKQQFMELSQEQRSFLLAYLESL